MNPQLVLRLGIAASRSSNSGDHGGDDAPPARGSSARPDGRGLAGDDGGAVRGPAGSARGALPARPPAHPARPAPGGPRRGLEATGPHGPIPVRVYHGAGTADLAAVPAHVYFHGGGWTAGDLDSHDWTCRSIANAARCAVVNVAYRVAPERAFPAAFDERAGRDALGGGPAGPPADRSRARLDRRRRCGRQPGRGRGPGPCATGTR